jgi:hypothetical protein
VNEKPTSIAPSTPTAVEKPPPDSKTDKRSEREKKRSSKSHHRSSSKKGDAREDRKKGSATANSSTNHVPEQQASASMGIPAIDLRNKDSDDSRERERQQKREKEVKEGLEKQDPFKKVFCHPLFATPRGGESLDAQLTAMTQPVISPRSGQQAINSSRGALQANSPSSSSIVSSAGSASPNSNNTNQPAGAKAVAGQRDSASSTPLSHSDHSHKSVHENFV